MSKVRIAIFSDYYNEEELEEDMNKLLDGSNIRYIDHTVSMSVIKLDSIKIEKFVTGSIAYRNKEKSNK